MFSVEQKLDYVKLMINEGCTNKQIINISGANQTAVAQWIWVYNNEQSHGSIGGIPPRKLLESI
jgi:hypothetical protein